MTTDQDYRHMVDALARDTIARLISEYIEAEVQLVTRSHGPEGRKTDLVSKLATLVDADAALLTRWVDWAVLTLEMGLNELCAPDIGRILANTLVDGWTTT